MNIDESYSELGLSAASSDAEIKAAWRRLSARWHPDRNTSPQALRKIQRINRALDEIRRVRESDLAPLAPLTPEPPEAPQAPAGRALDHTLEVTLEQAVAGYVQDLRGTIEDDCAVCVGSGLQGRSHECTHCKGSGQVRQHLWFGWLAPQGTCGACQGAGVSRRACGACAGSGKAPPRHYLCRVQVPAGARDGHVLHVPARFRGDAGRTPLTLRVRIALKPHVLFSVDADGTVKCELPVDGFAWTAERWIEVPTPDGPQQMRLRRGHLAYRIRGHGLPAQEGGPRGDCIVSVVPLFPQELSRQQEAQIDRLVASSTGSARTPEGQRMAAWKRLLAAWQAGRAGS